MIYLRMCLSVFVVADEESNYSPRQGYCHVKDVVPVSMFDAMYMTRVYCCVYDKRHIQAEL